MITGTMSHKNLRTRVCTSQKSFVAPQVSVVICTYNRAEILREGLLALTRQNASSTTFEVLIVNNACTDQSEKVIQEFTTSFANFRTVFEPRQGLSYARNTGYKNAQGEWIAYLDDDSIAHADLIKKTIAIIESHNFDCFGGVFFPWFKYGRPGWLQNSYVSNSGMINKTQLLDSGYAVGNVIVIKKIILESMNGFSTRLGMRGTKARFGEETLLQVRMRKAGYRIGLSPEIKVDHLVNSYKLNPWWLIKAHYFQGFDSWLIFDCPPTYRCILRIILGIFFSFAKGLVSGLKRRTQKGYVWQNFLLDLVLQPIYFCGQMAGIFTLNFQKTNQ